METQDTPSKEIRTRKLSRGLGDNKLIAAEYCRLDLELKIYLYYFFLSCCKRNQLQCLSRKSTICVFENVNNRAR